MAADEVAFTVEARDTSPAHLLMRIKSFSRLSKLGFRKFESSVFVADDYQWCLIIYPDGDECDKNGDHIACYVSILTPTYFDWEVNVIFNIFLFNQHSDNYLCFRGKIRCFNAMNSKWGYSKLMSKKTFTDPSNGFLVDDNCVFGAEVFVYKRQQAIECVSVLQNTVPCKHDLKISKFSKLKRIWISEQIVAGGHRWRIEVYPNGDTSARGRFVSIFMKCVDSKKFAPHQKVMANYTICIKNKLHTPHRLNASSWYTSSSKSWGWSEFIPISDMRDPKKEFVVDDCCFLEIQISAQVDVAGKVASIWHRIFRFL